MAQGAFLKIKLQLYCDDEIAIGPGKADLLDAIMREGSISAGARAMGMSYRRAWQLVDAMNRCWRDPLVETVPGGSADHGARLTPLGQSVLSHYRALQAMVAGSIGGADLQALEQALLPSPRLRPHLRPNLRQGG